MAVVCDEVWRRKVRWGSAVQQCKPMDSDERTKWVLEEEVRLLAPLRFFF